MLIDAGGPHDRHQELVLRVVLDLLSLMLRAYFRTDDPSLPEFPALKVSR